MSVGVADLVANYGLLIVFVSVLTDQLGVPFPAMPVLIVAGSLAGAGKASGLECFAASLSACVIADLTWFWIGKSYGMKVLQTLCRISLEPDSCVSETQSRFERWGVNSLIIAKFIPGLAIIAPPLAGALRLGLWRFVILSGLGSMLWTVAGLGSGMVFADQIGHFYAHLQRYAGIAASVLALLLAGYIGYKWWERRRFLLELRMARITVDELYGLMESQGNPVILDVRTHTARHLEPRWIPTAIHAPVEELEKHIRELERDREVVVYCACPNEASAARVAKRLRNLGFTRVRPLHGGLDSWVARGYRVETFAAAGAPGPGVPSPLPAAARSTVP
jgi:membrane protein DedA with SNARE-associated domain/rhodanese-related sulfurtransferase